MTNLTPLFTGRRTALTGGIPLKPVHRLTVEPAQEPVFWDVLLDLGASWLGVAPSERREVLSGRVLEPGEPGPAAAWVQPAAVAS